MDLFFQMQEEFAQVETRSKKIKMD